MVIPQRKGEPVVVDTDEHPRASTTLEGLTKLKPVVKADGTVTAGNASGINDGAAALLIASDKAVQHYSLKPRAKIIGSTVVGVSHALWALVRHQRLKSYWPTPV